MYKPEYYSDQVFRLPMCYDLYGGAHMGLGENRRARKWREIESTFRMLNIRRLMEC